MFVTAILECKFSDFSRLLISMSWNFLFLWTIMACTFASFLIYSIFCYFKAKSSSSFLIELISYFCSNSSHIFSILVYKITHFFYPWLSWDFLLSSSPWMTISSAILAYLLSYIRFNYCSKLSMSKVNSCLRVVFNFCICSKLFTSLSVFRSADILLIEFEPWRICFCILAEGLPLCFV